MVLLSTFELLVKPIAPTDNLGGLPEEIAQKLEKIARRVVQGYFLTIANTTNSAASLVLEFVATTPNLNLVDTVVFRDILGINDPSDLIQAPGDPKKFTSTITVPAHDTALFTLLPDLQNLDLFTGTKSLEIRGYVKLSRRLSFGSNYELLVTPEHRGTFLPNNLDDSILDFDQIAYTLPLASGGSLVTLPGFTLPIGTIESSSQPSESNLRGNREDLLSLMANRIAELEERLTNV